MPQVQIPENLASLSAEALDELLRACSAERDRIREVAARVKAEHDRRADATHTVWLVARMRPHERDAYYEARGFTGAERAWYTARASQAGPEPVTIEAGEGPETGEAGQL